MATKLQLITAMYEYTLKDITGNAEKWQRFLQSAGRNYKLAFEEQVLVHAQRPEAEAVLEIEKWNTRFGRWVNRGATGIAVVDRDTPGKRRLRYYFDISDTHESQRSRPVPLWEMQPDYAPDVTETLESTFGELEEKETLADAIYSAAKNAVADNITDYLRDLLECREDSFLEELDELNVEVFYRDALTISIASMLMIRCGIDTAEYFAPEDFSVIHNFNTPGTATLLGTATSAIAEMGLREIASTVLNLQNTHRTLAEERKNRDNESTVKQERGTIDGYTNLQRSEGVQNPRFGTASGGRSRAWQVRPAAPQLPETEPKRFVQPSFDERDVERTFNGNGENRTPADGSDDSGDGSSTGRDRGIEGEKPDGMGGQDEQYSAFGGGKHIGGADLQLVPDLEVEAGRRELPAFLDEKLIFGILKNPHDDLQIKKSEILSFFLSNPESYKQAALMKDAYPRRYTGLIVDGQEVGYVAEDDGLIMWRGKYLTRSEESKFSWNAVAELTAQLIEDHEYGIIQDNRGQPEESSPQLSFFNPEIFNYPVADPNSQLSFFKGFEISQQVIDEALCLGSNEPNSLERICAHFAKDYPLKENAAFLKEEYGEDGKGFHTGSHLVSVWFDDTGIRLAEGRTTQSLRSVLVPWEDVAKRVRELLNLGRFAPQAVLENGPHNEMDDVAANLWYVVQDFSEEAHSTGYLPTIQEIYGNRGGFPSNTEEIAILLQQPDKREQLKNEMVAFVEAFKKDPTLQRFRWSKAEKTLKQLEGLLRPQLTFSSQPDFTQEPQQFITIDEMDAVLTGGGNVQDSKYRIYGYFLEDHTTKERIDFLKHEYGTGGSSRSGHSENHDFHGIEYSRGGIFTTYDKVLLKWPQVEKRIGELMRQNRYMSPKELDNIPAYEKGQLAWAVYYFFSGVKASQPRPFSETDDHYEAIPKIQKMLEDPVQLTELIRMMEPVWENTPLLDHYHDVRERAIENIQSFRDGSYSLFGGKIGTPKAVESLPAEKEIDREAYQLDYRYLNDRLVVFNQAGLTPDDLPVVVARLESDGELLFLDAALPESVKEEIRQEAENNLEEHKAQAEAHLGTMLAQAMEAIGSAEPEPEEKFPQEIASPVFLKKSPDRGTSFDAFPGVPMEQRHNFHITDDNLGQVGAKAKFSANMDAIHLLNELTLENRLATPDEQKTLSRYVGWGALPQAYDPDNTGWASEYAQLKELLPPEEYEAARASTLNAHYTSPTAIKAIYKAVENMGFRAGNILDPGCGVGNFQGLLPESMSESRVFGIELDPITGRIARQLYQKNSIAIEGFEDTSLPDSFFDLAIGNVPFGSYSVSDKRYDKYKFHIHDFFFAKTLDKVRPGGVIAFVTSKYTMDKQNPAVRKYIAQRAELLGAIRLPNNAFLANAGTEVTTDIIFLQKRDKMVDLEPGWVHLGQITNDDIDQIIPINAYYAEHPEMVLGTMSNDSGTRMYGNMNDTTCVPFPDRELSDLLDEAVQNIHAEISDYERDEEEQEEDGSIPADPGVRNFSFTVVDGQIYYRENSRMHPKELSATAQSRVKGLIKIRDSVRRLITFQTENYPDSDIVAEQAMLNHLYDGYARKYGILNDRANTMAFADDESYPLLCSLEILDENLRFKAKADMFSKRTINAYIPITHVDTASEALAVSIGEKTGVDLDYMVQLTGKTPQEILADLEGVVFQLPQQGEPHWVTSDEYLSGNVRQKLQTAKEYAAQNPEFSANVTALEAVQPKDLTAPEISVRLGATWIPPEMYQQFIYELLGTGWRGQNRIKVLYSSHTAEWNITEKSADRENVKAFSSFGTHRMSAYHIIENTLNLRTVRVFDTVHNPDGSKSQVLNRKETAIAQDKQDIIKAQFTDWIWKDPKRREMLCEMYNRKFNSIRPREYDGRHIRFHGMNPEIKLDTHQVNAVARHLYGGNALFGHVVGAGKSFEMIAAGMEAKRLGLCNKALYVVPNNIIADFASDFFKLYPAANVLMATAKDFEKKNRKKFCARIATGEYDGVVIAHSQFEKIPLSIQRQQNSLQQQIADITVGINDIKRQNGERYTIKQMERMRKSLQVKLAKLNDQSRKDSLVTFEELGVDALFVDEADLFKNLYLVTKMRNVGGISQTESQKASDLFMKTRYLDEITGNRGTVFATGTPVSNSLAEVYTMQRYLQYDTLCEKGLQHFDCWASTFGETVTAMELTPEGSGFQMKTRFSSFYNLPELMAVFKEIADIQTKDMLNLPTPKVHHHTVVTKPSEMQKELITGLADRAEKIRNRMVDASEDNMLLITNDGRKIALDQRIINPMLPDHEGSKVNACADTVYRIWEETKDKRLTQLIFSDLSTPKGDDTFSVYTDIKEKLLAKGIPENEVAFIHDAKNEAQKKEIVAKVRSGSIRVLIGSTSKMGAGMNAQDLLIASHDLDCPWRPRDLEQRSGRIERRGNTNKEVHIYRYVTENSFDAYCYQIIENKQRGISQVFTSKSPARIMQEVDEVALSYGEIKALATGNPLIIERCNLEAEVNKLKTLKSAHLSQKYELEDKILKSYPAEIRGCTQRIEGYTADSATAAARPKGKEESFIGMTVKGENIADKKRAGSAILEACKAMTNPDAVPLGEYRGFAMDLFFNSFSKEYVILLKGQLSHSVSLGSDISGNITRLDNVLEGLEAKLEGCKEQLVAAENRLETAKTEVDLPFSREQELTDKTARLAELTVALKLNEQEHEILDEAPDEGDEASQPPKKKDRGDAR